MKTCRLCALMAVMIGITAFAGGAYAVDDPTILQVTGGGYLANGYKCGIAVVKKQSGKVEGTVQCRSVVANGKKHSPPQHRVIDCIPVDITQLSSCATSATISCRGLKEIGVTSGDPGDPTNNGTISATGWGINSFPATQILGGIVKVECVP